MKIRPTMRKKKKHRRQVAPNASPYNDRLYIYILCRNTIPDLIESVKSHLNKRNGSHELTEFKAS